MKAHHLKARLDYCLILAELSPCPRAKYGALLIDPTTNTIIAEGWNGPPRGPAQLCGGARCDRDEKEIISGQRCEVGCHHAEGNAIANAARRGARCDRAWIVVSGAPCLACAKLIHHAGISTVLYLRAGRSMEGIAYLERNGVEIRTLQLPPKASSSV